MTPMRRNNRVAIGTCRVLPEPDPDQALLISALGAAGLDASLLAWDDSEAAVKSTGQARTSEADGFQAGGFQAGGFQAGGFQAGGFQENGFPKGRFDLCVLRSTWNYYERPEAFLDWVGRVEEAGKLLNPGAVVRWNVHKRYLLELERAGIPIVPTELVARGGSVSAEEVADRRGWGAVVIKPAISASSFGTRRFAADERAAANAFLATWCGQRDMLVQRYLGSAAARGEQALIWIDGTLTHAVRKEPRFAGGEERVSEEATPIETGERSVAERAIDYVRSAVCDGMLYGRVDLMRDDDGGLCVSELELIEPSLYLTQHRPALDRLVQAIERAIGRACPAGS